MLAQVMEVSLAAPRTDILVYVDSDGLDYAREGTRFLAPMVTKAPAILRSIKSNLTAAEIKRVLIDTAAERVPGVDSEDEASGFRVPSNVGGKMLRVDNAVLHTVNPVRRGEGLDPYTREELLALYDFSATADENDNLYLFDSRWKKAVRQPDKRRTHPDGYLSRSRANVSVIPRSHRTPPVFTHTSWCTMDAIPSRRTGLALFGLTPGRCETEKVQVTRRSGRETETGKRALVYPRGPPPVLRITERNIAEGRTTGCDGE